VPKYQHRFCNTEYGTLKLSPQELAIVCELLVRGPQTPGELRTRASRMAPFTDAGQVEATLESLRTREDGPFVVRLPREPNRRDARYAHLFSGPVAGAPDDEDLAPSSASASTGGAASVGSSASASATPSRMDRLEEQVRQLREELDELKKRLGD
jgi:hypothetical protein